jgi:hypothetical protein
MIHQSFIDDRKGRVVVLMDGDKYDTFLDKVKEKKGNFWAANVDLAMHEAVDDWIAKEE